MGIYLFRMCTAFGLMNREKRQRNKLKSNNNHIYEKELTWKIRKFRKLCISKGEKYPECWCKDCSRECWFLYFYHPLLHNSDILKYLVWVSMAERSNVFLVLPDSLTSQLILTLKVLENKIVLAMGAEK